MFPGNLLPSTFFEAGNLQARNELQRREEYIELMGKHIGFHPTLSELIKQCLHNMPDERPTTGELLTRLSMVREEMTREYGGPVKPDMVRVRLAKEVKIKDRRIEELTQLQVKILI